MPYDNSDKSKFDFHLSAHQWSAVTRGHGEGQVRDGAGDCGTRHAFNASL